MMPDREVREQLATAPRWCLWDYANATRLTKVPVPIAGPGRSNRKTAQWALGQQHHVDAAGIMRRRGGVAIRLNTADATRYGALLTTESVELFIDPALPDLDLTPPPSTPAPTNGGAPDVHAGPTPTVHSRSRGLRLPGDLWDGLDAQSDATGQSVAELLTPLIRVYLQEKNRA